MGGCFSDGEGIGFDVIWGRRGLKKIVGWGGAYKHLQKGTKTKQITIIIIIIIITVTIKQNKQKQKQKTLNRWTQSKRGVYILPSY